MAQFIMAHLNNGGSILNATTTQLMHQQHFTQDNRVAGLAHGFIETYDNNLRIIKHGGNLAFSQSQCILIPEKNIGYYINYNANHYSLREELLREFMDTFFPEPSFSILSPNPDFIEDGKKFKGNYYYTRSDYTTPAKADHMLNTEKVEIDDQGYLVVFGLKWVQIDDLIFSVYNFNYTIIFLENEHGKITHLILGYEPVFSLEKQSIVDSLAFSITFVIVSLLTLLGTSIYIAIKDKIQRKSLELNEPINKTEKITKQLSLGLNISYTSYFIIFLILMLISTNNDVVLPIARNILIIPVLISIVSIIFLILVSYLWIRNKSKLETRIIYVIQLIFTSLFIWFLFHWNWIGFPY